MHSFVYRPSSQKMKIVKNWINNYRSFELMKKLLLIIITTKKKKGVLNISEIKLKDAVTNNV